MSKRKPDHEAKQQSAIESDNQNVIQAFPSTKEDADPKPSTQGTVHPYDINNFINRVAMLSDAEKYDVLCKVWKPESDHVFLCNVETKRRFRYEWLTSFPWLCYSAAVDGGFCINCVLFGGESSHNATKLQRLFISPLRPTTSFVKKLQDHAEKSPIHKTATIRALNFKRVMENQETRIDVQINNARQELIQKNRMPLRPIVGAILTCARQNIPLRGHRDDAHHLEDEKSNPGNFIEILKYGASCGNLTDVLFGSVPSNQTYRSKTIQNELIEICGDMVIEELVDDVKKAKFFSLLADEATDCSNTEQMAVVLRFIDESLKIREDYLGFIPCSDGLSGEALSENISKFITSIGLRMEECRGQGYDGAGNMAGKLSGLAARIQCRFEKVIYVHCVITF